jgi:glutamine synthetase
MSADCQARANYYRDHIIPAMEALRAEADALEMLVAKDLWPLPSYGDILFSVR